jgi:FK506-binding protein 4/5
MAESENVCSGIDVTENQDGGVIKVIKREGTGDETPNEGAAVYVHYVGTLEDGTQFDSSRSRGKPFDFCLGRGKTFVQLQFIFVESLLATIC